MGGERNLGALEITVLGGAWTIVVLGVVLPFACVHRPDSRLITAAFSGQFALCLGASGGLILLGGALVGGWWLLWRGQAEPFSDL